MSEENGPQDLDLASEKGGVSSTPPQGEVDNTEQPQRKDVEEQREDTRQGVTLFLLLIFSGLLLGGGIAVLLGGDTWENYDKFLRFSLPAVTGLLGTALGFYFGSQR